MEAAKEQRLPPHTSGYASQQYATYEKDYVNSKETKNSFVISTDSSSFFPDLKMNNENTISTVD